MRHYLRWHSCSRRFHCCSPLNSGQSGGKHGHAYLAGWPGLRRPLHSAAGRRRRRSGGCLWLPHHGTDGPWSSAQKRCIWKTQGTQPTGVFLQREKPLTCLMEWWWTRLAAWLTWWWCCREDTRAWTCFSCWATSCSAFSEEPDEDDEEVLWETGEDACWIMRCSISCSCCSAFTNAAFSLFVCSAFKAFFWLEDMQSSQSTTPPLALSCLQRQVKSVLHWEQIKGSLFPSLVGREPVFPRIERKTRKCTRIRGKK